ncbi:PREDICTED: uncharacterized protein LOC108549939 [Eufriesea mexicana]|uniref:uncharacterized protein LOC108549939 n=1 Tax=Eufriesea mexicana TaxID=516756 RepID=UPI00083BEAF9|nr:PREDICTED: uncharacterized protein LOC108549939 [Eufriesea mexicana]
MHRLGFLAMFAALAVVAQGSYDVCKRCNRSSQMLESQNFYYPEQRLSLLQDALYLPEEDHIEMSDNNQQQSLNRANRNLLHEYRSLCETVTKEVRLDDSEYEYQPPYYHEVYCKSYSLLNNLHHVMNPPKQTCVHSAFHCVQRRKTLLLIRRRWDSECWEPFTKQITSGCDCMWPVSALGDITNHY